MVRRRAVRVQAGRWALCLGLCGANQRVSGHGGGIAGFFSMDFRRRGQQLRYPGRRRCLRPEHALRWGGGGFGCRTHAAPDLEGGDPAGKGDETVFP